MKNIHLLPTPNPSKLWFNLKGKLVVDTVNCLYEDIQCQNICITNIEKIKEGDWVIYTNGIKIHCQKLDNKEDVELANIENSGVLKIILTTDQDLDGVQATDDEFLEWFVKNPSCEFVNITRVANGVANHKLTYEYKIIIPKEEPKKEYQTCKCGSNWFNTTVADKPFCFKCGESVKEDFKPTEETCTCTDECLGYLTKTCKGIEETALKLYPNRESFLDRFQDIERKAFIKGYKLAQERSYSEEDMKSAFKVGFSIGYGSDVHAIDEKNRTCDEWFEQFKKK